MPSLDKSMPKDGLVSDQAAKQVGQKYVYKSPPSAIKKGHLRCWRGRWEYVPPENKYRCWVGTTPMEAYRAYDQEKRRAAILAKRGF